MNIVTTYDVVGMTCDHCARSVAEEVSLVAGVEGVDVDLASGVVSVSSATTAFRNSGPTASTGAVR